MNYRVLLFSSFILLILLSSCSLADTINQKDSTAIARAETKPIDKWWGRDKAKHFLVSAFLTGACYRICHDEFHNKEEPSLYFSAGFTFSLGLGKEIRDQTKPQKRFSYKDLVYDLMGIGVGLLIVTR